MKQKRQQLYKRWIRMLDRCNNPKHVAFHRYGGRGIKVCNRWKTFENFWKDMHKSFDPSLTLERINNNKGYSVRNCRWASNEEQSKNKSSNVFLTYKKLTLTLGEWSKHLGINKQTLSERLRRGWSAEETLSKPVDTRHWSREKVLLNS